MVYSSANHCNDQWTREEHYANLHASWLRQMPVLTDAYLVWKHTGSPDLSQSLSHKFHITAVHVFELANISLLHVGLLSCSPTVPTVTISLQCLELYHQLRRRQSSFSIQVFTKVLCTTHNQPDELPLYPASLKAMDGNNSAKRMANAGHADHCMLPSNYMIAPDHVDVFKDDVQLRPGKRGADQITSCTNNWKAANITDENTVHIFLSACQHGIVQTVTEMRHSGELAKYPLATMSKLLDIFGDNQAIGSNIGCSLSKTAAQHKLLLSVNAFHGHAHNRKCQLQFHPMYLCGFGLEDLETCERIFASSNAFLDLHFDQWDTDKYFELNLGRFLANNYKQALTLIAEYTKELDAYHLSFPNLALDFDTWSVAMEPEHDALVVNYVEALEKLSMYEQQFASYRADQFLSYSGSLFMPDSGLSFSASQTTKQAHAARHAAEHQLQVQINIVEDLETRLEITEHWTPVCSDYTETLEYSRHWQFIRAVEDLEGLVVQHLFELSKSNLSSTGTNFIQISRAIVKCSATIHAALDKYNKLAIMQRSTLQYSEVTSYAALGEFDLLKHSQYNILTKPWSNATHCEMAIKYFKVLQGCEEITQLNVEICRLQAWIDVEDSEIEHTASVLESTNPPLAAEMWKLYSWQQRVNDMHRVHIHCIYSLDGFTGYVPSDLQVKVALH
ncbi:hypothetical protein EDB19DRAFT_1894855 [Suillus lakei]|nr:hypothetical protein EDB19DRAFT_1894855 [Suillus lakei]